MKTRRLTPEILDELPPDHPAAIRSRRDLRMINFLMGNYRRISRWLVSQKEMNRWVELGAGSGTLANYLTNSQQENVVVTGVDLAPRPAGWPSHWPWHQGDLFDYLQEKPEASEEEGVVANLFLHHFEDEQLRSLGSMIREKFSAIVSCEPARRRLHRGQGYLLYPLVNRVTRHDMQVSIEAGFRDWELADLLFPDEEDWVSEVEETFLGASFLTSRRKDGR